MKRFKLITFTFLVAISFTNFANAAVKKESLRAKREVRIATPKSSQVAISVARSSVFAAVSAGLEKKSTDIIKESERNLKLLKAKSRIAAKNMRLILDTEAEKKIFKGLRYGSRVSGVATAALVGWEIGNVINAADEKYLNSAINIHVGNVIGPLISEGDIVTSAKAAADSGLIAYTKAKELVGIKTASKSETNK